jgi:hypothetical protein
MSATDKVFAGAVKVPVDLGADEEPIEAWDEARDEAQGNCLL